MKEKLLIFSGYEKHYDNYRPVVKVQNQSSVLETVEESKNPLPNASSTQTGRVAGNDAGK